MLGILCRKDAIFAHFLILIGNILLLTYSFDINKKVSLCSKATINVSRETEKAIIESFKDLNNRQADLYRNYLNYEAGAILR